MVLHKNVQMLKDLQLIYIIKVASNDTLSGQIFLECILNCQVSFLLPSQKSNANYILMDFVPNEHLVSRHIQLLLVP